MNNLNLNTLIDFNTESFISGAVEFIILNHRYIQDIEGAAVACVEAGLNLELHGGNFVRGAFDWLKDAVTEKKLPVSFII